MGSEWVWDVSRWEGKVRRRWFRVRRINKESMGGSCLLPCQFEIRNGTWHCHMSSKGERVRV